MNTDKTEFMCFKQDGIIFILSGKPLKLVNYFKYLGSNISSTKSNINIHIGKAWNAIDKLSIMWKSDLSNKIKQNFSKLCLCSTTIWWNHLDSNEMLGEEAR